MRPTPRSPQSRPRNEQVALIKSGVNIVVDGVDQFGSIDVDTDNLVIWSQGGLKPVARRPDAAIQGPPLEIYMEGNVVFRQGERDDLCPAHVLRRAPPDRHRAGGRNPHAGAQVRRPDEAAGRTSCSRSGPTASWRRTPRSPRAAWACRATSCGRGSMTLRGRAASADQPLHRRAGG